MTTVAVDKGFLVADTQSTLSLSGNMRHYCEHCKEEIDCLIEYNNKIVLLDKPIKIGSYTFVAFASAGLVKNINKVNRLIKKGFDIFKYLASEGNDMVGKFTMLAVTLEGVLEITCEDKTSSKVLKCTEIKTFPYAIGSGKDILTGLMKEHGYTVQEALKQTMKYDKSTGGEVNFVDFSKETLTVEKYA